MIVVSGVKKAPGTQRIGCAIFKLSLIDGQFRTLLDKPDCNFHFDWVVGDISGDGKQFLATQGTDLHLLDLGTGRNRKLVSDIESAAWSPDGGAVAAVEGKQSSRRVLLYPCDFRHLRNLGKV